MHLILSVQTLQITGLHFNILYFIVFCYFHPYVIYITNLCKNSITKILIIYIKFAHCLSDGLIKTKQILLRGKEERFGCEKTPKIKPSYVNNKIRDNNKGCKEK